MRVRTEDIGFGPDEMIACAKCGKSNPPNRASCLYCANPIASSRLQESSLKLNLRRLENWENGYNLVIVPPGNACDAAAVARYFRYEPELTAQMLQAESPFPIARLESEDEAVIAEKYLSGLGLGVRIVSDVTLKIGKPNIRLRSLTFRDDAIQLVSFNTGERQLLTRDELALIVVGTIIESKMESVEKRKKGDRKVLSETMTSSDDLLVDLYAANDGPGWRIPTKGFDFSSLANEKSMLATENIRYLLEKLKMFGRNAKIVDEYHRRIAPLSTVWDIDRRKDFQGLKRTGMWKSGYSNIVRTSNLEQFSKYSRLQRILL